MRNFLAVIVALLGAFAVMMGFEFLNSFFYPLPKDLDIHSLKAVHDFTRSLPWTAFVLVLLGWATGSFVAGALTVKVSKSDNYVAPVFVIVLLITLAIVNFFMLFHPLWVMAVGLPLFPLMVFVGWRVMHQKSAF